MSKFLASGVREIDFSFDDDAIQRIKAMWKEYVISIPEYPLNKFHGTGIVMYAGGVTYFTCAWICINNLRRIGCSLPIELWHVGNELSNETIAKLKELDVHCRDFILESKTGLRGVSLKPLSILLSKFKDVLFLDADNNCLADPSYLFRSPQYRETGALFWPDYWTTASDNPIWEIIDSNQYEMKEQESGQMLINKEKCWKPLNLCIFFNKKKHIFHKLLYGDKDTFKIAWQALRQDFYMVQTHVACCGYQDRHGFMGCTMIQHDLSGDSLFLHRNLLRWDVTLPVETNIWQQIKKFETDAITKKYRLNYNPNKRHSYMDIEGDVRCEDAPVAIRELEEANLSALHMLRNEQFYQRFLFHSHLTTQRFGNSVKM